MSAETSRRGASPAASRGYSPSPRAQPQFSPLRQQAAAAAAGARLSSGGDDFGAAPPRPRKGSAASSVLSAGSSGATRLSGARKFAGAIEEGDFVWVRDPSAVCVPAIVVRSGFAYDGETDQEQQVTVVHTEDGEERELRDAAPVKLPQCHHPKKLQPLDLHDLSSVPLMTPNGDGGRTEVFSVEQLENVVLYALRARYRMEQVYTWVDRVLVSVNPVMPLPIYTPDHMQAYNKTREQTPLYEKDALNEAPPHVFAIAQNAVRCMQDAAEDQAVILLGSMGSGKSEAAKLIVQYLCEVGENTSRTEVDSDSGVLHPIGQQILHAFTILESFGNASTGQNRNSSRFAKMISVEFSKHGYVIGGGFTTHYFEKSRVVECRNHERNFHVFYQVLAGVQHDPQLRDALDLNRSYEEFDILKQAAPGMTDTAIDARDYRDLMSSFSALRIRKNQRVEIVRVIAALLHLGNVDFIPDPESKANGHSDSQPCALKDPAQIVLAAKLLEVEPVVLDNYFRTRQFFTKDGNNKTVSSLKVVTVSQARRARDTFIRSLYESLFGFLVETLNGILGGIFDRYEKSNIVVNSQGVHVLDIVGFENLDGSNNGFDQLCFNYWSEKVHNFYVHNTLAINFSDLDDEPQYIENRLTSHSNMDIVSDQEECLSLFENKPFGIFEQLNENSKVRSPNDEDFVTKVFAGNEGVRVLSRPNTGHNMTNEYLAPPKDWRLQFVVHHYCGKVTYNGKGLSAKNSLSISATCAAIMQSSKNAVLHAVGAAQIAAASNEKASRVSTANSSRFRSSISSNKDAKATDSASTDVMNQADALLHALNHTGKNFLVCVKPNEDLEEGVFDSAYVMKQIREAHLVHLMKASRSIFSVHLTYNHFFRRYKNVCGHRGTLESLLRSLSAIGALEEDKYVVGKLKVYLTSHQWKKLEKARYLYLNACATMIQRNMLRGVFRRKSTRLLYVMRGLRNAMKQRDPTDIIQHLADCTRILGKRGSGDIRVLVEGNQMIAKLDEEEYVKSIIRDATRIGHPALIEYAVHVAEKCCPWIDVSHLKNRTKSGSAVERKRAEQVDATNKRLRTAMIDNNAEALMATLATLDEPSIESLERKMATMMIIRALEEKSVIETMTQAIDRTSGFNDSHEVLAALLAPATKVVELGLELKFPDIVSTFASVSSGEQSEHTSSTEIDEVEEEEEEEEEVTPQPSAQAIDTSGLFAALDKAMEEENLVAVEKILARLQFAGVGNDGRVVDAERKLHAQFSNMSAHTERKQMLKFLTIAKVSQDLELLTDAIQMAVNVGIAKWDFNLKNAEREREKLLTKVGDSPVVKSPAKVVKVKKVTPSKVPPVAPKVPALDVFWVVWESTDVSALQRLRQTAPNDLHVILEAKLARLQQIIEAADQLARSKASSSPKDIEDALSRSIGIGFCSPLFLPLFERHSLLRNGGSTSPRLDAELDGLRATIKFLENRIASNAEIRDDVLDLLSTEIDEFASSAAVSDDERERVLVSAGNLRRKLETCIAAAERLESVLASPVESITLGTLELHVEAAKKAGVSERLLVKAEEKLLAAKSSGRSGSTAGAGRSSDLSLTSGYNHSNGSTLTASSSQELDSARSRADTTDWLVGGADDEGSEMTERKSSRVTDERDATAFNQFENLRGFNAQSERSLAKKLSWEGRAISQSLSVLEDPTANQLALSINRCILGYMRDRIVFYREMLAHYILQLGLVKADLVDEIYLQLMKQLTKNPKRDSSVRGWSLLAMCTASFPPSPALQKYVQMFLRAQVTESNSFWRLVKNFAAYSLKKLDNLIENGASGFIPSLDEIRGYEARPPFLATIELLDGTPLADAFPVTPELTVEQLIEICAHFLGLEDHVKNFLGLVSVSERIPNSSRSNSTTTPMILSGSAAAGVGSNGSEAASDAGGKDPAPSAPPSLTTSNSTNGPSASPSSYFHKLLAAPAFLRGDALLGDIFEKELIRGREVKFVLKIRLSPIYMLQYHDAMYDRLTYIQVQDEVLKGNIPLQDEEAVVRLAALAMAIDVGDPAPESVDDVLDMNLPDYIPPEWQSAREEEEWAMLVLETIRENLLDDTDLLLPVDELQRIYIEEVMRHRLYGAAFFPCKLLTRGSRRDASSGGNMVATLGVELPSYFVVAVNGYGVHFIGRDGAMLGYCDYADVEYCGGSYHQYRICLRKASVGEYSGAAPLDELLVTTKYADELSATVADYKEIEALMNEA